MAHCWSEPSLHKRKNFCTICRKRIEETASIHCMSKSIKIFVKFKRKNIFSFLTKILVCEYYCHVDCVDFAIPDCKENATYVPGKDLKTVKHFHHWREGNLPQSSKCAYCRKACWSFECLTGESHYLCLKSS